MNDVPLYLTEPPPHRKLRAAALVSLGSLGLAGLFGLAVARGGSETVAPAWHGSISVDCQGNVTVTSVPPGALFVNGTVSGVGTATVTASGFLDWPDYDEGLEGGKPAVSDSQGGCTVATTPAPTTTLPPTTTTEETTPSTTIPPSSTSTVSPSTTIPPTVPDSSVPSSTTTPTTSSPPSTTPVVTVPMPPLPTPTPLTTPRPPTTQPEPFCVREPTAEGCTDEGLPTAEGG